MENKEKIWLDVVLRLCVFGAVGLIVIKLEDLLLSSMVDEVISTIIGVGFAVWVVFPLIKRRTKYNL